MYEGSYPIQLVQERNFLTPALANVSTQAHLRPCNGRMFFCKYGQTEARDINFKCGSIKGEGKEVKTEPIHKSPCIETCHKYSQFKTPQEAAGCAH